MCFVEWVSPKALPSLHCFCKCCCPIHPHVLTTQNEKQTPPNTKKRKKLQEKTLEKSRVEVKMFNEDSCFLIYYNNKNYFKDCLLRTHSLPFYFFPNVNLMNYRHIIKSM